MRHSLLGPAIARPRGLIRLAWLTAAAGILGVGPAQAEDPAPYPTTVDELAQTLRTEHIIVQQTQGSGDAQGTIDRLADIAAELDFTTYVALISPLRDMETGVDGSRDLAISLARQLGPGLYVIRAGSTVLEVTAWDIDLDRTRFSLQVYSNSNAVSPRAEDHYGLQPGTQAEVALLTAASPGADDDDYNTPNLSATEIDALADREDSLRPYGRPGLDDQDPDSSWTSGKRVMIGTVTGLGAFLLVWQTLRGWPGWRRPDKPDRPKPAVDRTLVPSSTELRSVAERRLTELSEALADNSRPVTSPAHLESAEFARAAGELMLDSADVLDLIGAGQLALQGKRHLRIAVGTARRPLLPCFFNPLHQAGTAQAQWGFGEGDVTVPVCSACEANLRAGVRPDILAPARFGPDRPYYAGDSIWARTGFGALVDDLGAAVLADERRRRAP